eukprot:jgi/Ulvmu1/8877/UM049_0059.1
MGKCEISPPRHERPVQRARKQETDAPPDPLTNLVKAGISTAEPLTTVEKNIDAFFPSSCPVATGGVGIHHRTADDRWKLQEQMDERLRFKSEKRMEVSCGWTKLRDAHLEQAQLAKRLSDTVHHLDAHSKLCDEPKVHLCALSGIKLGYQDRIEIGYLAEGRWKDCMEADRAAWEAREPAEARFSAGVACLLSGLPAGAHFGISGVRIRSAEGSQQHQAVLDEGRARLQKADKILTRLGFDLSRMHSVSRALRQQNCAAQSEHERRDLFAFGARAIAVRLRMLARLELMLAERPEMYFPSPESRARLVWRLHPTEVPRIRMYAGGATDAAPAIGTDEYWSCVVQKMREDVGHVERHGAALCDTVTAIEGMLRDCTVVDACVDRMMKTCGGAVDARVAADGRALVRAIAELAGMFVCGLEAAADTVDAALRRLQAVLPSLPSGLVFGHLPKCPHAAASFASASESTAVCEWQASGAYSDANDCDSPMLPG